MLPELQEVDHFDEHAEDAYDHEGDEDVVPIVV